MNWANGLNGFFMAQESVEGTGRPDCQARERARGITARWQAPSRTLSKDKPKRDPKKPGRKPGSKYGRQAVRAIPVPDKTFEAPCPEQCPCGGKVGAEGSIDLYQVDIPPIQPETWKFVVGHGPARSVVGVSVRC